MFSEELCNYQGTQSRASPGVRSTERLSERKAESRSPKGAGRARGGIESTERLLIPVHPRIEREMADRLLVGCLNALSSAKAIMGPFARPFELIFIAVNFDAVGTSSTTLRLAIELIL